MTIVLATGGSGGHIFPALRAAEQLKIMGHRVEFCGVFGPFRERILAEGYGCEELPARGLSTDSVKTVLSSSCSMLKSTYLAFRYLRRVRPSVVAGFGGYGAFAVVAAAVLQRRRVIIHEQNVVPGRANRFLGPWVHRIAVSFEKSRTYWPPQKTVVTGCPYRKLNAGFDPAACRAQFSLAPALRTILVFGGSQGSRQINTRFLEALPLIRKSGEFQIIHMTGRTDESRAREEYRRLNIPAYCAAFVDDMPAAYGAADIVVGRSGAVTINEVAAAGLPAVLIPYPWAGGHQIENARLLADRQAALIITEDQLTPQRLADAITDIAGWPQDRAGRSRNLLGVYFPDAGLRLAQAITEIAGNEN